MRTTKVARPKKNESKGAKTIGFRVSGEYNAWIDGFAEHERLKIADLIDRALVEWAKAKNYGPKPPRRVSL